MMKTMFNELLVITRPATVLADGGVCFRGSIGYFPSYVIAGNRASFICIWERERVFCTRWAYSTGMLVFFNTLFDSVDFVFKYRKAIFHCNIFFKSVIKRIKHLSFPFHRIRTLIVRGMRQQVNTGFLPVICGVRP